MNYRTQSFITIGVLLGLMVIVGVSIGQLENSITGASVTPVCECAADIDCDDGNANTVDICMEKDSCDKSNCVHK